MWFVNTFVQLMSTVIKANTIVYITHFNFSSLGIITTLISPFKNNKSS